MRNDARLRKLATIQSDIADLQRRLDELADLEDATIRKLRPEWDETTALSQIRGAQRKHRAVARALGWNYAGNYPHVERWWRIGAYRNRAA